jgi:hypothetical protein
MATIAEKRQTNENNNAEIKSAMVVANYGDPGLEEQSNWDILSRFVICKILSTDRVLTSDKWADMLVVVARPQSLWINAVGGLQSDPTQQQRADYYGNINIGLANNYSVNAIAPISQPYNLGDIIRIKALSTPLNVNNSPIPSFFNSIYTNLPTTNYGAWYSAGSTLPYIQNAGAQNNLSLKTVTPFDSIGDFCPTINKYQYEAFQLLINNGNNSVVSTLTQIFLGQFSGGTAIYSANGGYVFNNQQNLPLPVVQYVDTNELGRSRVSQNSCIPLVVVSNSSFPMPASRSPGTISFNPIVQNIT